MAKDLDERVAEFKDRPLDAGPYRYVWIDALTQRVREGGRVVLVSAVIATAVNAHGQREIIGFDIVTTEDTEAWTTFLRGLVRRGLSGVDLVISDAHGGIKAAIAAVFADALWQRCRTHFMANLCTRVPKTKWPMIATLVRSIFEQPDRDATWAQLGDVADKLTAAGFDDIATYLLDAADDVLAFRGVPGRALAQDPQQQPSGAAQQGDPPAHRRGRHLPQPGGRGPPGGGVAGRADRRVGHYQALHVGRDVEGPHRRR
jgi:putative transposase